MWVERAFAFAMMFCGRAGVCSFVFCIRGTWDSACATPPSVHFVRDVVFFCLVVRFSRSHISLLLRGLDCCSSLVGDWVFRGEG